VFPFDLETALADAAPEWQVAAGVERVAAAAKRADAVAKAVIGRQVHLPPLLAALPNEALGKHHAARRFALSIGSPLTSGVT
jgi:hypothetical protein